INFPEKMPTGLGFLAGKSLSGTEVLSIPSFDDLSKDYLAAYFSLPTSIPGIPKMAGLQISFDGSFKLLGAKDIESIGGKPPAARPQSLGTSSSATFPVAPGSSALILNGQWDNPLPAGTGLTVVITDPNGNRTTLHTNSPTATGPIQLVP